MLHFSISQLKKDIGATSDMVLCHYLITHPLNKLMDIADISISSNKLTRLVYVCDLNHHPTFDIYHCCVQI